MKKKEGLSYGEILKIAEDGGKCVHFVGVGGVSMYSLAVLTLRLGARVTGSDREENERTRTLAELGVPVSIGHGASSVGGASLVVYSHAVSPACPELSAAKNLGVPTLSRAEYMGALMIKYKSRIGISGTHGKSTTTAMLDLIFERANTLPTVLSGAPLSSGESYKIGSEGVLIYEACEYRDSFLRFSPSIAIALNLELDHTDYFAGIEDLKRSFAAALSRASSFALVNIDDENLSEVLGNVRSRTVTFGASENADYRYRITAFLDTGCRFAISRFGQTLGEFTLGVLGAHNAVNAAAAAVCALEYGIDIEAVKEALASFRTISRRLELIGRRWGREIYYDYAHHPTEIAATLETLRLHTGGEVTAVFCPHTYSRTAALFDGFRRSLSLADYLVLTEIYSAREEPIEGVSSARLAAAVGSGAVFLKDGEVVPYIDAHTRGAIVLMGAGDLSLVKEKLLS